MGSSYIRSRTSYSLCNREVDGVMEHLLNDYKALEVSALASEGMAATKERQAQELLTSAAADRERARQAREEMGRIIVKVREMEDEIGTRD